MEFLLKKEIFKKLIMRQIFFQVCLTVVLLIILFILLNDFKGFYYYVIIPIFLVYELIKLIGIYIRMKKEWYTYRIFLNNDCICKTQYKNNDISIMYDNIQRIIEIPNSGISIQTYNKEDYLYIPKSLENYEVLKNELMKWKPIEITPISQPTLNNESIQFKLASRKKQSILKTVLSTIISTLGGVFFFIMVMIILVILLFNW